MGGLQLVRPGGSEHRDGVRILELALFLSTLPALLAGIAGWKGPRWLEAVCLVLPVVFLVWLIAADGTRLHLVTLYITVVMMAFWGVAVFLGQGWACGGLMAAASVAGFLGLGVAVAAGWAFPIFELPKPTGPYRVGTTQVSLPVGIVVQMWYPADDTSAENPASYWPESRPLPSRMFGNLRLVHTHALSNASVGGGAKAFPVIFYSPSWGGGREENSSLCETLASEGFVVAAVDHPLATALPSLDFSSDKTRDQFLDAAQRELERQTSLVLELYHALNLLESGQSGEGRFKGRLDVAQVGVVGYSFGGAVAAEACRREPGFKAGVDLDGTLFGEAARTGASQPFLFVTDTLAMPAEADLHSPDGTVRRTAEFYTTSAKDIKRWLETRGGWLVRIEGVQHANFSDRALYSNLRKYSGGGTRDARKTLQDINACVVAFFDQTLRQKESPLLRGASVRWPGVKIEGFSRRE